MRTIVTIELKEAREAAEQALAEAHARNHVVTVCIADAFGVPILLVRDDDARSTTVEMAMNKAWTAAAHRRATHVIAVVAQPGQPGFGVNTQHSGKFSLLPGGLPVIIDSAVVGGVGVSGADAEVDIAVAAAAVTALTDPR